MPEPINALMILVSVLALIGPVLVRAEVMPYLPGRCLTVASWAGWDDPPFTVLLNGRDLATIVRVEGQTGFLDAGGRVRYSIRRFARA